LRSMALTLRSTLSWGDTSDRGGKQARLVGVSSKTREGRGRVPINWVAVTNVALVSVTGYYAWQVAQQVRLQREQSAAIAEQLKLQRESLELQATEIRNQMKPILAVTSIKRTALFDWVFMRNVGRSTALIEDAVLRLEGYGESRVGVSLSVVEPAGAPIAALFFSRMDESLEAQAELCVTYSDPAGHKHTLRANIGAAKASTP